MNHAHRCALLRAEVVDLHRFFVRWYSGEAAPDEAAAVTARFRSDFVYIFPSGRRSDRADLVEMLDASHGANPAFRIFVGGFAFQPLLDDKDTALWGVTYEEYQSGARNSAPRNGRISSAVLSIRDDTVGWVRLHECWLPDDTVAAFHDDFGCLVAHGLPPAAAHLPAIRAALAAERDRGNASNTLRMRALCAQLFCAGDAADAVLIWQAKQSSFDAACSIEAELMCGAGRDQTIAHLAERTEPAAAAALAYLRQADAPEPGYRAALLAYW